jgi:hypothetical protein
MRSNVLLFGWNRSTSGRELVSSEHFQEFVGYLIGQQEGGVIDSFEVIFLDPNGGDLGGFFLIRGVADSLDQMTGTSEWMVHVMRGGQHLDGQCTIRGATGDAVMERMALFTEVASR